MKLYSAPKTLTLNDMVILWFATLFCLSSNTFKVDLGMISVSPAVLIPVLCILIFSKPRKRFLNEYRNDINFAYTAISVALFSMLMVLQTIFSDWPDRAPSALAKTLLFFLTTHAFFSILSSSKISLSTYRILIWSSLTFVLYIAYVYLVQFGMFYIGNDLTIPTKAGRNTLSLYLFLMVVVSLALVSFDQNSRSKYLDYSYVCLFLVLGAMTGSRFAVIFPLLFIFLLTFKKIFKNLSTVELVTTLLLIGLLTFTIVWGMSESAMGFFGDYFEIFDRLSKLGETGGDNERLVLLDVGFGCFIDQNILFGNGVKNYLTCVMNSPLKTDYILHNDHLSILNNVGIIGYSLWLFIIINYAKIFSFYRGQYFFRLAVVVYLASLLVIDGYNSPIFAVLIGLARLEWSIGDQPLLEGS